MKVSQYLYTSWKNAPNYGFSLYSKSADVTQEEDTAISQMMKYRAPKGLPYDPTEDEIERMFPRSFAYFRLPTGRYCLAQSVYIGHEYKGFEDAGRMGNFLIHAFVFQDDPSLCPASFIGSDVFRRDLTLEEWRASNPPALPATDIPAAVPADEGALSAFLSDPNRKKVLALLVQAVMNRAEGASNATIYLNDTLQNLKLWYLALTACLPARLVSRLTFTDFSMDDCPRLAPELRPWIFHVRDDGMMTIDYRNKMLSGALVFDLQKNLYSEVNVGTFVSRIVETLAQRGLAAAASCASLAEDISKKTGLSLNDALTITDAINGNYDAYATLDSLMTAFRGATAYRPAEVLAMHKTLCAYLLRGKYPKADTKELFVSFYPEMDAATREAIVSYYADSFTAAGDINAVVAEFKRRMPFGTYDFAEYALRTCGAEGYLKTYGRDFGRIGLLFAAIAENYRALSSRTDKAQLDYYLFGAVRKYVAEGNKQYVNDLLKQLTNYGLKAAPFRVDAAQQLLSSSNIDLDWFFELVTDLADDPATASQLVQKLLLSYPDRRKLVESYGRYADGNARYAPVDKKLRESRELESFYGEYEKFRLTSKPMDTAALVKFYTEYCLEGKDKEGMLSKYVSQTLNRKEKNERPKQTGEIYAALVNAPKSRQAGRPLDGKTVATLIEGGFTSVPLSVVEKTLSDARVGGGYRALAEAGLAAGLDVSEYLAVQQAARLPGKVYDRKRKSNVQDYEEAEKLLAGNALYSCLRSDKVKKLFMSEYLARVAFLLDGVLAREKLGFGAAVEGTLGVFIGERDVLAKLLGAVEGTREKFDEEGFIARLLIFAETAEESKKRVYERALEEYFDGLKPKECKKIFKTAEELCPEGKQTPVHDYAEAYTASHKKSIFGWFKKK